MRVYSSEELDRLRLIKRLVDDLGVNLAGVQQLLSVSDVVQRMRPLMHEDVLDRRAGRRQLVREVNRLTRLLEL
tara:strand:+ start:677 stop:898 length:222 start_codon:yes stop_codon:yes gene_type:complete